MPIFSPGQTENLNVFPNFSVDCSRIYASCHRCFPRENFSRLNSWPWAAAINLSWHVVSFTSARAGKIARFLHRFTFSGPCWHPSPSPLGLFSVCVILQRIQGHPSPKLSSLHWSRSIRGEGRAGGRFHFLLLIVYLKITQDALDQLGVQYTHSLSSF